jgi:hypothetical protein
MEGEGGKKREREGGREEKERGKARPCPCPVDICRVAAMPFSDFLSQPWLDNGPKPWAFEAARGHCINILQVWCARLTGGQKVDR